MNSDSVFNTEIATLIIFAYFVAASASNRHRQSLDSLLSSARKMATLLQKIYTGDEDEC